MNPYAANQSEAPFQPLDLQQDAVLGLIAKALKSKNFREAEAIVETNFETYSSMESFLLLAAETFKAKGHHQKESHCLQKLVDKSGQPRHLVLLSESLTKLGDYPAALKLLHQVVDEADGKDPILFEVYKNMGNIYLKCGDIDAAEEKYNLANGINSEDEHLIINYGVLAIQKGEYDKAKEKFSQVIYKNKASDLAWVGLALVHRAHGDHDLARACLLRGIDENPYNKLAIIHFYQWSSEDGIDATDEIVNNFIGKYPEDKEIEKLSKGMHQ